MQRCSVNFVYTGYVHTKCLRRLSVLLALHTRYSSSMSAVFGTSHHRPACCRRQQRAAWRRNLYSEADISQSCRAKRRQVRHT